MFTSLLLPGAVARHRGERRAALDSASASRVPAVGIPEAAVHRRDRLAAVAARRRDRRCRWCRSTAVLTGVGRPAADAAARPRRDVIFVARLGRCCSFCRGAADARPRPARRWRRRRARRSPISSTHVATAASTASSFAAGRQLPGRIRAAHASCAAACSAPGPGAGTRKFSLPEPHTDLHLLGDRRGVRPRSPASLIAILYSRSSRGC